MYGVCVLYVLSHVTSGVYDVWCLCVCVLSHVTSGVYDVWCLCAVCVESCD